MIKTGHQKHPWQDDGQRRIVVPRRVAISSQVSSVPERASAHPRNVPEQQETPAKRSLANAPAGRRPPADRDCAKASRQVFQKTEKNSGGCPAAAPPAVGASASPPATPGRCAAGPARGSDSYDAISTAVKLGKPPAAKDGEGQAKMRAPAKEAPFSDSYHPKSDTVNTRRQQTPARAARRRRSGLPMSSDRNQLLKRC